MAIELAGRRRFRSASDAAGFVRPPPHFLKAEATKETKREGAMASIIVRVRRLNSSLAAVAASSAKKVSLHLHLTPEAHSPPISTAPRPINQLTQNGAQPRTPDLPRSTTIASTTPAATAGIGRSSCHRSVVIMLATGASADAGSSPGSTAPHALPLLMILAPSDDFSIQEYV
ncbi:hypothetical protein ZWY2020_032954 [Hordeum vulgare]|nr:hypothetical protein ZWY2020_032954 [Hordeum vulgare]